jgi:crotonobetainyl-CoA:carnitine CoA-transferase CaiB-like acyl-CoA transferase
LEMADVPHSPILKIDEVVADRQVRHLGIERRMVHPTQGVVRTMQRPIVYDRNRGDIEVQPPPVLDEHGGAIRKALLRVVKRSKPAAKTSTKRRPGKTLSAARSKTKKSKR